MTEKLSVQPPEFAIVGQEAFKPTSLRDFDHESLGESANRGARNARSRTAKRNYRAVR